mgnify:FL=1
MLPDSARGFQAGKLKLTLLLVYRDSKSQTPDRYRSQLSQVHDDVFYSSLQSHKRG